MLYIYQYILVFQQCLEIHYVNATDPIIAPIDVSGTTNYNFKILDVLELKIESIIIVGYDLDTIDPITVQVDEFAIINYNLSAIGGMDWCWRKCV